MKKNIIFKYAVLKFKSHLEGHQVEKTRKKGFFITNF
jgi:hypothetical protein